MLTEEQLRSDVLPHRESMYRIALAVTGDEADACDVVAEVVEAIWQSAPEVSCWRSYCLKSARLRAITAVGRRKGELAVDEIELPDMDSDPSSNVSYALLETHVDGLIDALPKQQRDVMRLNVSAGLGKDEIAATTGLSEGNVRQLLSRARRRLRDMIAAKHSI